MVKLSINVNKIATIRNARGHNTPDLSEHVKIIEECGADGITVHPRPDGRHIKTQDVYDLSEIVKSEYNIEGYPSKEFLALISEVRPDQVTLVPDPPEAITSSAGWAVTKSIEVLKSSIEQISKISRANTESNKSGSNNIRVSIFIDPYNCTTKDLELLKKWGAHRIELYTESFANSYGTARQQDVLDSFIQCAQKAESVGLNVNAGHDLNLNNLAEFAKQVPNLKEVSIGQAFISDSLIYGYEMTLNKYKNCLRANLK